MAIFEVILSANGDRKLSTNIYRSLFNFYQDLFSDDQALTHFHPRQPLITGAAGFRFCSSNHIKKHTV